MFEQSAHKRGVTQHDIINIKRIMSLM